MKHYEQSILLIERMQSKWLSTAFQQRLYRLIVGSIIALGFFLNRGLIVGLITWLVFRSDLWLPSAIIYGLSVGPAVGLQSAKKDIEPIESLKWSRQSIIKGAIGGLIFGLIFGLRIGLPFGLAFQLFFEPSFGIKAGLFLGLLMGLFHGLHVGLRQGLKEVEIEIKTFPNQGIWLSIKNTCLLGLISGLLFGCISSFLFDSINGFILGSSLGLGFALIFGGEDFIKHFILRFILYRSGYIPWNLARFLDFCTDRIFLRKVGGGYIFIHRYLMEYFASLEPEQVE